MILVLAKATAVLVAFFGIALFSMGLFIILMVLVQRGKGGGLAGALGGAGGQSAFGARATDQITWLTASTVALWILFSASAVLFLNPVPKKTAGEDVPGGIVTSEEADGGESPEEGGGGSDSPETDE